MAVEPIKLIAVTEQHCDVCSKRIKPAEPGQPPTYYILKWLASTYSKFRQHLPGECSF